MYEIRRITSGEVNEALGLALEVFMEFEAPDYKPEGVETFKGFIRDDALVKGLKLGICPMYAAFVNGKIVGIIGMRANKTHINLAFVKKEYHRKGIATAIFRYLLDDLLKEDPALSEITLNSSPYGLPFYLHLGFVPQSEEQEEDGIRYTPMRYDVSRGRLMNKSLEELENSFWDHNDFDSYVVRTTQAARKKLLRELSNEEIRVLTGQKFCLKYILPMA
ncbi:MAG: GNAT family N-acetyltransferase, partial [Oscillospiraceae bacterium]|nr:GNAT family N-acetyltransferase [Oscillospiraceae bacterium]